MRETFTIGFTKKTAKSFFEILIDNGVEVILDIRLNNTSQLSGFSKYPDIEYFLKVICDIEYIHDVEFSPTEVTLKKYKKKEIDWTQYVHEFNETMRGRDIINHIRKNYTNIVNRKCCLLCSESTADQCHRKLVSNILANCFNDLEIIHL